MLNPKNAPVYVTGHEVEFHLDAQQMLKYLERNCSIDGLAKRLGLSRTSLYNYRNGTTKLKNRSIYDIILMEYYRVKSKERTKRILRLAPSQVEKL